MNTFLVNLLEFSSAEPHVAQNTVNDNKNTSTDSIKSDAYHPTDTISAKQLLTNTKHNDSYKVIPYFYHKLPKSTDLLAQKLREEARTLFLQKRSKELLDNNELKALWNIFQKNYTQPSINNEQFINYDDYLRVVKIAGEKFKWVWVDGFMSKWHWNRQHLFNLIQILNLFVQFCYFQNLFDFVDFPALASNQRISWTCKHYVAVQLYNAQSVATTNSNRIELVWLYWARIFAWIGRKAHFQPIKRFQLLVNMLFVFFSLGSRIVYIGANSNVTATGRAGKIIP